MAVIEFTDNFEDLSTDQGFQFKFHCERCGEVAAKCPDCGTPTLGKKFCPGCGKKLAAGAFCGDCGAKLSPGAKFCGECGAKQAEA